MSTRPGSGLDPGRRGAQGAHGAGRAERRLRPLLVATAAPLGVLLVVLAAVWSVSWGGRPPGSPAGTIDVGSGVAVVDQVLSAARPQHAMPGMGSDDDPVATGERRVSVEVTLQATGDEPLRFSVDDFALRVGDTVSPPHRSLLPAAELPPGTSLSGVLVFDVPRQATVGHLSYDGGRSTELRLPAEEASRPAPSHSPSSTGSPGAGHPTVHATP
ncbi:DUF4352 domain-containing protein [Knoellia sp. CPCC 206435]|uniref:DUF4352 domain-containing protein n=1 Tax=Knoellia terrae TaxID=3404797 RepID=UPI003B432B0A